MATMRVACVQLNTGAEIDENFTGARAYVEEAAAEGARLVVLPETWSFKGSARAVAEHAESLDGPSSQLMSDLAAGHGIYVLAGSIYERAGSSGRAYNTSVLFGPGGDRLAVYRKLHLFDVTSGQTVYRESETLEPGREIVTAEIDGVVAGLTICYDLRFPELYRALALRGARLLLIPSAFTAYTGAAHWEVLLRARAIENGCFVVAPNQTGSYLPARESFGHSMMVDPWGRVLAQLNEETGVCMADLDLTLIDTVRADVPSLLHRRPEVYGAGW